MKAVVGDVMAAAVWRWRTARAVVTADGLRRL
jgi:hypothetical protein